MPDQRVTLTHRLSHLRVSIRQGLKHRRSLITIPHTKRHYPGTHRASLRTVATFRHPNNPARSTTR